MMRRLIFWIVVAMPCLLQGAFGQGYRMPPSEVIELIDAPNLRAFFRSPDGRHLLIAESDDLRDIAYLAQPIVKIAGMRIFPHNNSQVKERFYRNPTVVDLASGGSVYLQFNGDSLLGPPIWAHDGRHIAFPRYTDRGVELWVAEVATGAVRDLTGPKVNATLSPGYRQTEHMLNAAWTPDSTRILVHLIPEGRGLVPDPTAVPMGPIEMFTSGRFSRESRWEDLLKSAYHEALFEYFGTSQLAEIDISTGDRRLLGKPGLFFEPSTASPDGRYLLVRRIQRPYSYWIRYREFGNSFEVWNADGALVQVLAETTAADEPPEARSRPRPRFMQWQAHRSASLVWTEAESEVPDGERYRDRIVRLEAPFDAAPSVLARFRNRVDSIKWLPEPDRALVYETERSEESERVYLADFRSGELVELFSYSQYDRYDHPGVPFEIATERGEVIVRQDDGWIYLSGPGGSDAGDRPFLDRFLPSTLQKERLFESDDTRYHEEFVSLPLPGSDTLAIRRQSLDEPPDFYRLERESGRVQRLTSSPNPHPQFAGIRKQMIRYFRSDGIGLSGTLYLPKGYREGVRLPLVIWAYPRQYVQPRIASQVRIAPRSFKFLRGDPPRPASVHIFLTQGYAVLDMAEMPVVGPPDTRNDTYIEQIVASAKAAIDKLDDMGIADPERVGMVGHSYGGFSTANLLAHCNLFAAGIARSNAYNRTLTPWGFQREGRNLWEAVEFYLKVSPLFHADKITSPLLLIHGEADDSQASKPMQSHKMFHALRGFGVTAKLVLLPFENHRYHARESILHVAAEKIEWFDRYVKKREQEVAGSPR